MRLAEDEGRLVRVDQVFTLSESPQLADSPSVVFDQIAVILPAADFGYLPEDADSAWITPEG